jgi:hypothetical protein
MKLRRNIFMIKTKRIHHFVDKKAIATSIELYKKVDNNKPSDTFDAWEAYWESLKDICPGNSWSITCSLSSIFQAMRWANTLTVDRVYELILVSGVNTVEVEIDDRYGLQYLQMAGR